MTLKFTVGMALYDRETGGVHPESLRVAFTAMSLAVHHPLVDEIIVVDNNPLPNNTLPAFLKKIGKARYVPMPEPQGTSPPRNRVFAEARNEHVACIDSHVLLYPGFFESLAEFYEEQGYNSPDLLHGPIVTEAGHVMATHMNDQWRSEMWGTWGRMWTADDKNFFSFVNPTENSNNIRAVIFNSRGEQLSVVDGTQFGVSGWAGHERVLESRGFRTPNKPFPVPGHGMGFFSCRKDSWLPFHPEAKGFGGEEMTTGLRFRHAGRRCWTVPGAKWWHHFERPWTGTRGGMGAPYPLALWDRIRNYVLEFKRLGLDTGPIYRHFKAQTRGLPEGEWQQILAGAEWPEPVAGITPGSYNASRKDAVNVVPPAKPKEVGCAATGETPNEVRVRGLENLYTQTAAQKSNMSDDMPVLRKLAETCGPDGGPGRVVELGTHRGLGAITFLAAKPKVFVTYNTQTSPMAESLKRLVPDGVGYAPMVSPDTRLEEIPTCDLLFINSEPPTAERIGKEAARHFSKVSRYIAFHGTVSYGERHNNDPGVLPAIRGFIQQHPEWKVVAKYDTPSGLVVLSKNPKDFPEKPITLGGTPVQQKVPDHGPGTELKAIISSLGINPSPTCDCNGKAAQMNVWGIQGCRDNFNTIVGWLRDGQGRWGWAEKFKAAALAVKTGLAFHINWADPFPGIIKESIRRAEEKENKNDN